METRAYEHTTRPVSGLIPYAKNSRTHSSAQVAQIAASIREFGWTSPCLIDERDNLIAGHGRILAARKLGMKEVPCIVVSGLTDAQRKALVIADNKLALNAGWDNDILVQELGELAEDGFDLNIVGFSPHDLQGLGIEAGLMDPTDGVGGTAADGRAFLQWGNRKVPLDDEEMRALEQRFEAHVRTQGVAYGFARSLLGGNG